MEVTGAEMKDGMLHIDIDRIIPEDKKPKEIEFKGNFLKELRKNAKPLPPKVRKELDKPIDLSKDSKLTFLSKYDTSKLNVEIK